jgi:hypothetical protein
LDSIRVFIMNKILVKYIRKRISLKFNESITLSS